MVGYSGKSLVEKLGLKTGLRVYFDNPPVFYEKEIASVLGSITVSEQLSGVFNFIHSFVTDKQELTETFPKLKEHLAKDGLLWISWPKGSSKIPTDLNENVIRDIGLEIGLVDVKVIAVDPDWSGLKFVFRLKDR